MSPYLPAFLIGVVAGLRALTAPAAVSWGARLGWLPVSGTPLSFLGSNAIPYVFSVLAIGELINDKMPKTPSRKAPPSLVVRVLMGALSGGAIGAGAGALAGGAVAGGIGALVGTFGGYEARVRLAAAFGKDLPAALIEDAIAVGGAFLIVSQLS